MQAESYQSEKGNTNFR